MTTIPRRLAPAALLLAGLVVVSSTSGAVAGAMITGKQIKDGTVTSADIKDLSLRASDTSRQFDTYMRRVSGYRALHATSLVQTAEGASVSATCPGDTTILGTAAWWTASTEGPQVQVAETAGFTKSATAYANNNTGNPDTLHLTLFFGRTAA
jgi:hypothetical protein